MITHRFVHPSRRFHTIPTHHFPTTQPRPRTNPIDRYNYNPDPFASEPLPENLSSYKRQTALSISKTDSRRPLRRIKLLSREFIEDSLCNPHYGYFSTQVKILGSNGIESDRIEFNRLKNFRELDSVIGDRYGVDQCWHTPTELFKPWYAHAVARCLLSRHDHDNDQEPLRIYEIGAGNGTLCEGILNYLRDHRPEVYNRTTYTIIEVSNRLGEIQSNRIKRSGHDHKLQILAHNVFDLPHPDQPIETKKCWVIGMELIDNLARDVIRHDRRTGERLMGSVATDEHGEFHEFFEPISDQINPLLSRYLRVMEPSSKLTLLDRLAIRMPFGANLGQVEFVPTRTFELVEILRDRFPKHRLLLSDFDHLPQSIKGIGAPVVQTRYEGMTVPCTTYLVQPGRFDIFFPTDFDQLIKLYHRVINPDSDQIVLENLSHSEFLEKFSSPDDLRQTFLMDGSNAMLEYYENVRVLVTK